MFIAANNLVKSQWFLSLLSNQAWAAIHAAQSWLTEDSRTTDSGWTTAQSG